jgi:hypothetical protein
MKVTYYSTLYKRDVTVIVLETVVFDEGMIKFASGGHKYAVDLKYVKKIESLED